MAFGWNRTRHSPIAVDFGAHSLKMLQIVPGDPPQLLAAGEVEIPTDGTDRWEFLGDTVRRLVRDLPFKGRFAVCTTPAHQTLIQHLQLAGGERDDLAEAVGQELRERMNINPSRMVVRHFHVGQFVRGGTTRQEVLCVAASRDTVMRYIKILKSAGLETAGIYSEPQTVVQAFAHLYRRHDDDQRTTCFIDLGAGTVKAVIAHGTQMVFAKTVQYISQPEESDNVAQADARPVSGPAIPPHGPRLDTLNADSEADLAGADDDAADWAGDTTRSARRSGSQARTPAGLAVLEAPVSATTKAAPKEAGEAQDSAFDCLIDELQLCLRYHQGMFGDRPVEQVVFLGGGSRVVARCQRIAQALRIAAQLGDPLARLSRTSDSAAPLGLDMRQPQPGWAVPMGLCLSQT